MSVELLQHKRQQITIIRQTLRTWNKEVGLCLTGNKYYGVNSKHVKIKKQDITSLKCTKSLTPTGL